MAENDKKVVTNDDGSKYIQNSDGSRTPVYDYPKNLPDDHIKVNQGVPDQIGQGDIDNAQQERTAQEKAAQEAEDKGKKKPVAKTSKGGK